MKSTSTILILVLSFVAYVTADTAEDGKFDEFFDNVLKASLKKRAEEIEPLNASDIGVSFDRRFGFVHITGEAIFADIQVNGLSSLHRSGNSSRSVLKDGRKRVSVELSTKAVSLTANSRFHVMGLGPRRRITGKLDKLTFQLTINHNTTSNDVELHDFKVKALDGLALQAKKRELLVDKITNLAIRASLATFRRTIRFAIQVAVKRTLRKHINDIKVLKYLG